MKSLRTLPPEKSITLVRRQIEKGNYLLANRPLTQGAYGAWENTTREILIKSFGSDSENIDTVMLRNRAGSFPFNADENWWENYRVNQLKEQLALLESTIDQLQIELEMEEWRSQQDKIVENHNAVYIDINKLKDLIAEHFNNEELKDLCFKLSVKYEDLGESIQNTSKSRSLVEYMMRQERLLDLLLTVGKERPKVDWSNV